MVKLLSGGNPQMPKGEGNGPVQAYIDAVPGWKQPETRYDDVREGELDEEQLTAWVKAASTLPLEQL